MSYKVLNLNLPKAPFLRISRGEQKIEYREAKEYWRQRLLHKTDAKNKLSYRRFDLVKFRNGYDRNAPYLLVECLGIELVSSRKLRALRLFEDKKKEYFEIRLGKVLKTGNIE